MPRPPHTLGKATHVNRSDTILLGKARAAQWPASREPHLPRKRSCLCPLLTQRKLRIAVPVRNTILAAGNLHGHARDGVTSWSRSQKTCECLRVQGCSGNPRLHQPCLPGAVTATTTCHHCVCHAKRTQRRAPSCWMEGGLGAFLPLQTFSPTMVAMLSGMWFPKPTCELWGNSIPRVYVHSVGLRVPVNTASVFLTGICHSHTRPHTTGLARGKWTLILTAVSSKMTFWWREK